MKLIKIFTASTLLLSALVASDSIDDNVVKFEKERFSQNKRIKVKNVKVNTKKVMPQKGWYGYVIDIDASMGGNDVKAKDVVFSNGELIAPELFDIKTGMPLKDLMNPTLSDKYYNKAKLIAGNYNAKDKIVVFSDPLCPFCMDYVPDVINHVKKNSKEIALFYYHFPLLRIHPASGTLVRLMNLAKVKGLKDVELKVYAADWDQYFTAKEKDAQKIIDGFNKEFKTSFTLRDVNNKENNEEVFEDVNLGEEAMVQGTPTIFINGEQDKSKLKYEILGN
ncbi:MAG: disulfide bond formation protein DsbA [Arcobacter sp.]|nr:MAG: disulfide bond formation protein DsbA [Arcobacter sp.]